MDYKTAFKNYLETFLVNTVSNTANSLIKTATYELVFPDKETAVKNTKNYFKTESSIYGGLASNVFGINKNTYQYSAFLTLRYVVTTDDIELYFSTGDKKNLIKTVSPFGDSIENEDPKIDDRRVNTTAVNLYIHSAETTHSRSMRYVSSTPKGFSGSIIEIVGINGYDVSLNFKIYDNFYEKPIQFLKDVLLVLDKKIITLDIADFGRKKYIVKRYQVSNLLTEKNAYSVNIELLSYDNTVVECVVNRNDIGKLGPILSPIPAN
jgi:hypothetical protein